jgi:type IV pilus assembly protein PilM
VAAITQTIQRWLSEPPPEHLFEISDNGVAFVMPRDPSQSRLELFPEKALEASPSAPNLLRPQAFREALGRIATGPGKRDGAAVVIPDYDVRMAILDFEDFPSAEEDRLALIRFRLRKSVPFHIEEAQVAYSVQLQETKRVEVFVVAIARPILLEYESLFTDLGYRVGLVAPSCIAALPLFAGAHTGMTLIAKLAGTELTLLLIEHGRVRLVRCLDLASGEEGQGSRDETVLTVLQQTVAFAEDQIGLTVERLLLCGFGQDTDVIGQLAERELKLPYAPVRSRYAAPVQANTGLLGLLEQYTA